MIEKLVVDGKVAVLYSPDFGAGWSTWIYGERRDAAVFDAELAQAVLNGDADAVIEIAERKYPDECHLGLNEIAIAWLPIGTAFTIEEYDGSESIRTFEDLAYVA